MTKKYKIAVDCAACALKMEAAAAKVEGVAAASIGFMSQKLAIDFVAGADPLAVMEQVRAVCKKIEPDCEIVIR